MVLSYKVVVLAVIMSGVIFGVSYWVMHGTEFNSCPDPGNPSDVSKNKESVLVTSKIKALSFAGVLSFFYLFSTIGSSVIK